MTRYGQIKIIAFIAVILTVFGLPSAQSQTTSVKQIDTSEDEKTIRHQADDYVKAYTAGDFKTIASMWAADGTYADVNGHVCKGRNEIEHFFQANFAQNNIQPIEISIESIKFLSDTIAVEEGHSRPSKGPYADIINHYMVVHKKQNEKWQMFAVIETKDLNGLNCAVKDLGWLVGSWEAKPSAGGSIYILAMWATGGKFIRCIYNTENPNGIKELAALIIGEDPSSGRVVSWHFDASGGFGSGRWSKDGETWIERANSVEANGTKGNSINTFRRLDNDTFVWCSSGRFLQNTPLPDTEEIKITRQR